MKIFIDFDDTVFCSKIFIKDFFKIFQKNGVSKEVFSASYYSENEKTKGVKYKLENQLKRLKKLGFDVKKIKKEVDIFLINSAHYVFSDTENFFNKFKRNELYLLSYSKTKFQKEKITRSGISKFFQKVIITNGKKSEEIIKILKNKNEKVFFVDDWNKQIDEVKKEIPEIIAIFLKRKMGRYQDEKTKHCDFEAKNLKEVSKIINKLKEE